MSTFDEYSGMTAMGHKEYPHSTITNSVHSYDATNSPDKISNIPGVNKVMADRSPEILQWLSPLDPIRRHQDVRASRLDGVGDWILETSEFQEWKSNGGADKAVLFCYGNPGVGKTYLSSLVIDSLCDGSGEEDIAVAGFYCDFREQQKQTTANIMGAILKQLVVRGEVLGHAGAAFREAGREVGGPGLPEMVRIMKQTVAILPRVFICIDALDECLPKHQPELLESLRDILRESPRARVFMTGRPQVRAEIKRYFATGVIVPISPRTHDIERYLERKLEMDSMPDAMPDGLRADILKIIPERINEIFLLVSLNIDAILGEVTISERRQRLKEITKGKHVKDAYATTISRMKAQKGSRPRFAMEALMWVSNSERPLHTGELCHALGVKIGSTDLDIENVPTIRTLLGSSLGLITVEPSSDTVRLIHFTLQEYIFDNPSLFQSPHSMIAEVCLTYLNFQSVRELPPTLRSAPPATPLAEYASCYWGKHLGMEKVESVNPLGLRLLIGFERHISSQLLLLHYHNHRGRWEPGFHNRSGPNGFTGLHGAAFLGIVEIVAALLVVKRWDINATDAMGRTALAWAAVGGHEAVVKMLLLQRAIGLNTADTEYGQTALGWAAQCGNERIVKLLLERGDINPNTADTKHGQTPLLWAARGGREGIVRLLLGRQDVNPNTADAEYGRTPLGWAAGSGDERVVKLLLERKDIDPDPADTEPGRTPLLWAAEGGHVGVVKLLLEREDIDPNTADTAYGQTPLSWAAAGGHERVVKLLLDREDINPNISGAEYGLTPLLWAVRAGHAGVVGLLLERESVNPNTADTKYGRTPLGWAAKRGYEKVAKLLLSRDDVNPHTRDLRGETPLELAASCRHAEIMKLLSIPKPSLLVVLDPDEVLGHPSLGSSAPLQSRSRPAPSVRLSSSKPPHLSLLSPPFLVALLVHLALHIYCLSLDLPPFLRDIITIVLPAFLFVILFRSFQ